MISLGHVPLAAHPFSALPASGVWKSFDCPYPPWKLCKCLAARLYTGHRDISSSGPVCQVLCSVRHISGILLSQIPHPRIIDFPIFDLKTFIYSEFANQSNGLVLCIRKRVLSESFILTEFKTVKYLSNARSNSSWV